MEQLNRIELRGIVGTVRYQPFEDRAVCNFSLATSYVYKNRDGDPVIETQWHSVNAWEGKAMPDLSKIGKGTKLYVVGRLRSQKYVDNDGVERTSYEVAASQVTILDQQGQLQYEM
ncbi:MAG: single-stranded DNA-binding protein [Bacteroidales bacterium]|nr:single-stranded DNA-binding protein [Bacteroidales bacterium]